MRYQAEMLAQVLRLALARALELEQALPQEKAHLEGEVVLLRQSVQALLRQAVALQQLAQSDLPPKEPLLELGLPEQWMNQLQEQVRQELERQVQQALVLAEQQAEVLEPGQVVALQKVQE